MPQSDDDQPAAPGADTNQDSNDGNEEPDPTGEASTASVSESLLSGFGVVRDGIGAVRPVVQTGFNIARTSTDFGFALGRMAAATPFLAASWLGYGSENSTPQQCVEGVIDLARSIALNSIDFSAGVTNLSLHATDGALSLSGAERGETRRLLTSYVESLAGQEGYETKEALLGLANLLSDLGSHLTIRDAYQLMAGAKTLSTLHAQHRKERIESRQQAEAAHAAGGGPAPELTVPGAADLQDWSRFMHYAAAAYGYLAIQFLGMFPEHSSRQELLSDRAAICRLTGVEDEGILLVEYDAELYRPGHFIAVHHGDRQVVVAIRGSMRAHDVLVDLVCEPTELVSVFDKEGETVRGSAHTGFLRSAQRLAGSLHELVATALGSNPGYELVITGHSLGGGVATLLALLWACIPMFRQRNIRAFAFAAPCSVCAAISQAPFTRRHIQSIVTGDDIVSRLNLGSFKDLQRACETLAPLDQSQPNMTLRELMDLYHGMPREALEERLFCAGRVWWLHSQEYEPVPILAIDPRVELHSIELLARMFAIHLPSEYLATLRALAAESS